MFKNVLVGVDGRPNGRDAIALASHLADASGEVTLAHVHGGLLPSSRAMRLGRTDEQRASATSLLEGERAAAGVDAKLVGVEALSPGRGLHELAEAGGADLLVVGSCHRGAWGRAALGDDTRAALNGAPCAVAIASRGYAERSAPPARLGVAYDESPESVAALELARELAVWTGASALKALQVVTIPAVAYSGVFGPGVGSEIELMVRETNERMRQLADVEGRAVYGLPGEELAHFGDEVELLVVGSRGYGPLKRVVLGSTSEFLERHAHCTLLVLPRVAARTGGDRRPTQAAVAASA